MKIPQPFNIIKAHTCNINRHIICSDCTNFKDGKKHAKVSMLSEERCLHEDSCVLGFSGRESDLQRCIELRVFSERLGMIQTVFECVAGSMRSRFFSVRDNFERRSPPAEFLQAASCLNTSTWPRDPLQRALMGES